MPDVTTEIDVLKDMYARHTNESIVGTLDEVTLADMALQISYVLELIVLVYNQRLIDKEESPFLSL